MDATTKTEFKEISPSELGLEISTADAVLDALIDREDEFKRNPNLTNGQLLAREVNALIREREDNKDMDLADFITEWADSHTEVYTTEIFKWYSQNANRVYYADEAISEFGYDKDGGIVKALQMGIYNCLEEFAYSVFKDDDDETEE
jgi:hypothetical protein